MSPRVQGPLWKWKSICVTMRGRCDLGYSNILPHFQRGTTV